MDWILSLDESLFRAINVDGHVPLLDFFLPFFRNKYFWLPFYVFVLGFIWVNYRRKGWFFILSLILCVSLADNISSQLLKKSVKRLRPCKQEVLKADVQLLARCGSGYSFPSSHATNHFAFATFFIFVLGSAFRWIRWPLILWAALISFSQVYVGVHFPIDVCCGAMLGISIGCLVGWVYSRLAEKMGISLLKDN